MKRVRPLYSVSVLALAGGAADAQVLDFIEPGEFCPAAIGCQVAVQPHDAPVPADACNSEDPVTVTVSGERLLLGVRSPDRPQFVSGSLSTQRLEPVGDGCWAAAWRLPYLSGSKLTFTAFDAQSRTLGRAVFEGPDSDGGVDYAELSSDIETVTLNDTIAGIERRVHVYAPPQMSGAPVPVLILPDGQAIRQYARIVQDLIDRELVPPLLIIAIEARMDTPFARSNDYVPHPDTDHHRAYLAFFEDEFIAWIEAHYRGQVTQEGWMIFGTSASATFALTASRTSSPVDQIIAASPAASEVDIFRDPPVREVAFHISAGLYEEEFQRAAARYSEQLRAQGAPVRRYCYYSGHDLFTWEGALRDALVAIFGGRAPPDLPAHGAPCPGMAREPAP